jgi:hypothetical protein
LHAADKLVKRPGGGYAIVAHPAKVSGLEEHRAELDAARNDWAPVVQDDILVRTSPVT